MTSLVLSHLFSPAVVAQRGGLSSVGLIVALAELGYRGFGYWGFSYWRASERHGQGPL